MTSIEIASMMVWLMPSMISGSASGSRTFKRRWRRVVPMERRRLDQRRVDLADAERGVADRRRERVEDDGDHRGEVADAEQHHDGDQIDEARQRLQRVDDRLHDGPEPGCSRPAAMPIGMPISPAMTTETPTR